MSRDAKIGPAMGATMSLAMSLTLSGVVTLRALGPGLDRIAAWARSFALAWALAVLPAQGLAGPIRRRAFRLAR